jgi:dipeptidyl-peptidase 4
MSVEKLNKLISLAITIFNQTSMRSVKQWIGIILWSASLTASAQGKLLSLKDIYLNYSTQFRPASLEQLQWRPETENFTFVDHNRLIQHKTGTLIPDTLLTLAELNMVANIKEEHFPTFTWMDANHVKFLVGDTFVLFDMARKIIDCQLVLPKDNRSTDFCIENHSMAFTLDSNLYISGSAGNVKLTSDGGKGIAYGIRVHRDEFGITKGTFWSPNGHYLAFYRMDETMVTDYPLVDVTTRVATVKNMKYPMAGMTSHQVKVGVYNVNLKTTVYLETGTPLDHYLTNVAWSPDEKYIFIALLNREQNHMWLNQYDVVNGKLIRTLFEETNPKYVEPLHPMYFLADGSGRFLWQSRRDGFNHLYLYDFGGKLIKQVTSGSWEVLDLLHVTSKGEVYFNANIDNPIETQLCTVNLKSGNIIKITSTEGTHSCSISSNGKYILDTYSSVNNPGKTDLLLNNGKLVHTLFSANNSLKDYKLGGVTTSTILANDGKTLLYYRLIKPLNFDPAKKYPVIVYVYGGPHEQLVTNEWPHSLELWQYFMAEHGYVCFMLDNRGSENRGRDFENIIHRNVGVTEMQDQMSGVSYLKSLPYVDTARMGVHGWSFGGFMTTSLMLNHPNIFKAGVAGGPVMDWRYYEVMYGERYMDTPQENPDGYEKTSCLNKAQLLKGKLLIIHGAIDPTVVWQNSLLFIEGCIKNKRQVDYFVYPTHEHNVTGPDRFHLMEKVTEYFNENL